MSVRHDLPLVLLTFSSAMLCLAAGKPPQIDGTDRFDPKRAMEAVRRQVNFGPRPPGSAAAQKTRDYLKSELRAYGLEVTEQAFTAETPRGRVPMVNLRARFPSRWFTSQKPILILGAHYDTKWLPQIHFVGANDGASGTAVLLEVARVLAENGFRPAGVDVEFVFFDGEEAYVNYNDGDGLYGSREYVRQWKAAKAKGKSLPIRGMILLDMIGDRSLSIQIPQGDPSLTRRVFDAAQWLGYREVFHSSSYPIFDDHHPFACEGVPAVDLIDFEYGPDHRWWHTEEDTPDKLSSESLGIVGRTVLKMLEEDWRK